MCALCVRVPLDGTLILSINENIEPQEYVLLSMLDLVVNKSVLENVFKNVLPGLHNSQDPTPDQDQTCIPTMKAPCTNQ